MWDNAEEALPHMPTARATTAPISIYDLVHTGSNQPTDSADEAICLFAKQSATYKERSLLTAPRTDPSEPNLGTRLPPRVHNDEASAWPWMKNPGFREKVTGQLVDPFPSKFVLLTTSPQRA